MTLNKPYSYGPYNKFNENEQWIRITEGCPLMNECELYKQAKDKEIK